MSQPATPTPPASATPPRSPVERAIVWGVILVGLILIGVELQSSLAHGAALENLQKKLQEIAEKDVGMTKQDVDALMGTKVPESRKLDPLETAMGASRVDIYSFKGLMKERKVFVYYGVAGKVKDQVPEVMEVGAVEAETAAEAMAKAPKPDPNAPPPNYGPPPGDPGLPPGTKMASPAGGAGPPATGATDAAPPEEKKADEAKPAETKAESEEPAEPAKKE